MRRIFRGFLTALLVTTLGCSGQVMTRSGGAPLGGDCLQDSDCASGACRMSLCVDTGGNSADGDSCIVGEECSGGYCSAGICGSSPPPGDTGDACTSDPECASGRCEAFGSASICTEACTDTCPGPGLACFGGTCVPADYCEDPVGNGSGPGCTGSGCDGCDANATCMNPGTGWTCVCNPGYSGDGTTCTFAGCDDSPCENGGTCLQDGSTYVCQCRAGFAGANCQIDIDECAADPCLNGGSCTDGTAAYTCSCATGFAGVNCETNIDDCSPNPCQNGGTCVDGIADYACQCTSGWAGENCDVPSTGQCSPDPCQNGGTCSDLGTTYSCSCADGFEGTNCETNIDDCTPDPCVNGTCTDLVDGYSCACDPGWEGTNCDQNIDDCTPDPCVNGTCTDLVDGYNCACDPGWEGTDCDVDIDDCDPNPCQHGQCTDQLNGHTCACDPGWQGSDCDLDIDECAASPCQNGGTCSNTPGSYTCSCRLGWTGKDCDTLDSCADDSECSEELYCDGATCAPDVCTPLESRCSGQNVIECLPDGSGESTRFVCLGRPGYYAGACTEPAAGKATCTCEDDWDCPPNTVCDVDTCSGTGLPPTCSLPPEPFSNVLPTIEIEWGGTQADPTAFDHTGAAVAFNASGQVVLTPLVANLDDDNGDGLINERDFPEIIFMTFCGKSNFRDDGVLRAIHGGGPNKGKDFFAACAGQTWHEGDDPGSAAFDCTCGGADLNPTFVPAVGDLDGPPDGIPEIIAVQTIDSNYVNGFVRIYSNTGDIIATSAQYSLTNNSWAGAVTIANLDRQGTAEIIIGNDVMTLSYDGSGNLQFQDHFVGAQPDTGAHFLGPITCVADLVGDDAPEIIQGSVVYAYGKPACAETLANCSATCGLNGTPEEQAWCNGELYILHDGGIDDGFCAVADVWGADEASPPDRANPLDGQAELVLVREARLYVYGFTTGTMSTLLNTSPPWAIDNWRLDGGAPNIDDFDGDGFPEVGTAFALGYGLFDLQPQTVDCQRHPLRASDTTVIEAPNGDPTMLATTCTTDDDCDPSPTSGYACNVATGLCVCTHNSWARTTEDDSSRVTGSSVFDFNGDGAAEVVYNDECKFRVYDGVTGNVYFDEWSESRTRVEYPAIADVDNDGNAEIVFGTSNESGFCDGDTAAIEPLYNNGVEVWGDAGDFWVSARRIWNQHAYHVTNVTEGGALPLEEPKGWVATNGRFYNTYRSNPRSYGVAPDLTVESMQVVAAGGGCGAVGATADIIFQVTNIGDLRVGPGVTVCLQGSWGAGWVDLLDAGGDPLVATITNTLEPRRSVYLTVPYDAADNSETGVPSQIRATADCGAQERECDETNNQLEVTGGGATTPTAELRVAVGDNQGCVSGVPTVAVTVFNDGAVEASSVVVRLYAGDPAQGGSTLQDVVLPGPIPAGGSASVDVTISPFPGCTPVTVFGVVDPDNDIVECNDGNNTASQAAATFCCIG